MLDISLDMLGLGELESDLLRVSSATANKAIRDAVLAGARVARDKSRESAPVRSGTLKRNLVVTRLRQSQTPGAAVAGVSIKRPAAKKRGNRSSAKPQSAPYYWLFLEFGTSNMNAKPFLRPAWDNNLTQIEQAVRSKLAQAIDQALSRGA